MGSDHALSGLYRSVILHLLSATVAAFSVSPHSLAAAELEAFVAVVAALMDGQPELCDAFWEAASPEELEDERGAASGALLMPLVSFLDATRGLFPAAPLPLLSLLSGLAQGAPAAVHAYIYLKELPGLTVLHDGAAVFASVGREDGSGELVTTRQPLALPGDFFTLPQGVQVPLLGCLCQPPPLPPCQQPDGRPAQILHTLSPSPVGLSLFRPFVSCCHQLAAWKSEMLFSTSVSHGLGLQVVLILRHYISDNDSRNDCHE